PQTAVDEHEALIVGLQAAVAEPTRCSWPGGPYDAVGGNGAANVKEKMTIITPSARLLVLTTTERFCSSRFIRRRTDGLWSGRISGASVITLNRARCCRTLRARRY